MNKLRKQSNTTYPLFFLMVDSTDHVTGKTGLSPTVTISKNGGSFASPSGAVSEVGNGLYKVAGNATDSNTLGELWIHATGTGADPTDTAYTVVPYDPFDAVRLGLTALPNAAAEAAGGLYTRGSGAGQINQPANGQIDANTVKVSGTTQTARDIGASVLLSSGTGTGQLDFTSGVVKSNMTQIDGLATSGNNATLNLKRLSVVNSTGDALVLTSSGSNGRGANITGHGTSEGILVTGGGTGVKFKGGSTLGNHGLVCQSSSAGGSGIFASGTGSYAGISAYNTTAPTGGGPGVSIQSYDASGSVGGLEIYSIGGRSVVLGEGASPITGSIEGNINGNLSGSVGSLLTVRPKKNTGFDNFMFPMFDATTKNPKTGLTVTAERAIDGNPFSPCSSGAVELSNGVYRVSLSADDLNGNKVMLRFSATGADDQLIEIITQD